MHGSKHTSMHLSMHMPARTYLHKRARTTACPASLASRARLVNLVASRARLVNLVCTQAGPDYDMSGLSGEKSYTFEPNTPRLAPIKSATPGPGTCVPLFFSRAEVERRILPIREPAHVHTARMPHVHGARVRAHTCANVRARMP